MGEGQSWAEWLVAQLSCSRAVCLTYVMWLLQSGCQLTAFLPSLCQHLLSGAVSWQAPEAVQAEHAQDGQQLLAGHVCRASRAWLPSTLHYLQQILLPSEIRLGLAPNV